MTKIWAEPVKYFGPQVAAAQVAREVVGLDEDMGRARERTVDGLPFVIVGFISGLIVCFILGL